MPKTLPIILISLLLLFGIVFFWWPKYQQFSDSNAAIKEKKTELENKNKYFSELEQISLKLKDYDSQLAGINSAMPQSPGITDLLNFLGQEVSQNGLFLEKINLGVVSSLQEGSKILKVPIGFSVSGTYPSFKNFLSDLQKNARIIEIESVSFSSPEKGDVFSFDLIIRAHSY